MFEMSIGRIPGLTAVEAMLPELAAAAQSIYDAWDQIDGLDEELGSGGICQDVASALAGVLSENGVEDAIHFHQSVGENHVFLVARLEDGVFSIDIPPSVYEIGGGFVWKKREGIVFGCDDIVISRLEGPMDEDQFIERYSE